MESESDIEQQANKTTIKGFRASSILIGPSSMIFRQREEIRLMVQRDGSASNSFQPVHIILGSDKLHPREVWGLVAPNWWEACQWQLEMLLSINSGKIKIAKFS
ncbi:hypothetical protein Bca52824_074793 [Brassica carinata]|uniref:Uncharacterized protein n=1 Tax=Brassica carinata TaxID=52824 RepID=A0A8X7PNB1_BRACI|nr:hypothetical protein Bca52824_074793 [Brassica carinata]